MRNFWIVIVLFLTSNYSLAQDKNLRIASLRDSIFKYKNNDPDKAITFGFEALRIADFGAPSPDLLAVNTNIGEILFYRNLDAEALRFYDESIRLFEAIPKKKRIEKKVQLPAWVLVNIGNIYFKNNNFEKARETYSEAAINFELYENEERKLQGLATINNNYALIEMKNNNFIKAEKYLNTAFLLRNKTNKIEDRIYSNLGFMELNALRNNLLKINEHFIEIKHLFEMAKNNFTPKQLSTSYLLRNYSYAFSRMGDFYKAKKEYELAKNYYKKARELLHKFPADIPQLDVAIAECHLALDELDLAKVKAKKNLDGIKGDFYSEEKKRNYRVLEKIYNINNEQLNLLHIKDSLIKLASLRGNLNLRNKFSKLESNILLSKKKTELNESKIRYNTYLSILIVGSTILLFSLISMRLNFNLQKEKAEKITVEKKYIQAALEHKKIELINKSNYIAQRNQNLNYILESVDKNKNINPQDSAELIKDKIALILKTENINQRFEKQFEEVYPGYFKKLIQHSNKLSQNDLRLCAYLKMNQNTHEIAQLCGASIRTIESQKYRLKKKLGLLKEDNLIAYLITI